MNRRNPKRGAVMESHPNLPQESLEDILSRVPYKSLMRFKCVCKQWYALFDDPIFLNRHLWNFMKIHNSGDCVLLRLALPTNDSENYMLFSLSSNDADYSAVESFKPIEMLSTKFQISGHCNGILCLSVEFWNRSKEILLYNPATREIRSLPDSSLRLKISYSALAVGMGYDSQTRDYRVLRIWRAPGSNTVEEYALSTDSWTELRNTNAGNFHFDVDCFAMFFKGTYYWWAFKPRCKTAIILALNMGDDVFYKVSKPPHVDISNPNGRSLVVWNGSISLICCNKFVMSTSIDIWMIDRSIPDGYVWTKMRSITHLPAEPKPLVFWKRNELLLQTSDGMLQSYNFDTQKIENVKIKGNPVRHSSQAVNYVAIPVSVAVTALLHICVGIYTLIQMNLHLYICLVFETKPTRLKGIFSIVTCFMCHIT